MSSEGERSEEELCELLEWDSEHFGFPVARVVDAALSAAEAELIDRWCVSRGVRCLYLLARSEDAESARVAAERGFRAVDVRITATRSLDGVDELPAAGLERITVREALEDDLDCLRDLAARSHRLSRFYFDGSFPRDRCDALYQRWIERGFSDPARILRVAIMEGEQVGYHLLGPIRSRRGRGELLAIDERWRGRGIGRALVVSSMRLNAERGATSHRSVHSVRSLQTIRLHERLGFQTDRIEVWQHKWFES